MAVIYISHPFAADPEANRKQVVQIARGLALQGHLPLAPQLLFPNFVDEAVERDLALKLCLDLIGRADEVRAYGKFSEGMRLEIAEAERLGIPVVRETACEPQGGEGRHREPDGREY